MSNENQEPDPQPGEDASRSRRLTVIGIGASAGGLSALQAFFSALPPDTGLTFVVVVHLSTEHESMLAQLLQPHTTMPVQQVTGRIEMQPNHVYIIPPGKHLLVTDEHLDLTEFEKPRGPRMQIDLFFRSLAEQHGDGAAIILSGMGSDGSVGIQSIKEHGGLVFAQAPEEAEFESMPQSAIATGLVDVVGPVAELAAQLVSAKQTQATLRIPPTVDELLQPEQHTLMQILAHLRTHTGHDFSQYKRSTLLRRITRRMQLVHLNTLPDYYNHLRQTSNEADALFQDLLIHVTEFFRDAEAWITLAETVIPHLFAGKGRDDQLRVWTVGCATGEEAYGLAILLLEYAATLDNPPNIQVFASDLGQKALQFARTGTYPEAIAAAVSEERLERFFSKENSHYQVRPAVRERVLFTEHNLLKDPPFSKLDLISCRNLLIYLERNMQGQLLQTFYYALRPDGYLFLGSAETVEDSTDFFEALDRRHRIYQRSPLRSGNIILPSLPLLTRGVQPKGRGGVEVHRNVPAAGEEHQLLLEEVGPPSLLVDADYKVLHVSETAGRYLLQPSGSLTDDALRLVRPELQDELRMGLYQAFTEGRATETQPVLVRFNGESHPVSLLVRPGLRQRRGVVIFLEREAPQTGSVAGDATGRDIPLGQMEAELRQSQGRLQTMYEEYKTTVEELRAANEELQSTNEEYRATLEELETGKEELQSMNEELQTINQELKLKVEAVSQAHSDLQNLFSATEIATLFLDRELRIKRYTPRAATLFNLQPGDHQRAITHLRSNLVYDQIEADTRQVLAHLIPVEREVQSADGAWFQVNTRPYRTVEDRIDGVVVTFVDISERKRAQEEIQHAKVYAESIVETLREPLLVLTPDLQVQSANQSFYTNFQVMPEQTVERMIYELGNGQWDIPELRLLLEEILPDNKFFNDFEISHEFERIGRRTMLLNARRLDHVQLILLACEDITARKQVEEALRQLHMQLEARVEERTVDLARSNRELDQFAHVASHDLRAPLRNIQLLASWVLEDEQGGLSSSSQTHLMKLLERIQRMDKLLNDLFVYAQASRQRQPFERVDMATLVRNIVALLDPPAGFTVTLAEPMPVVLTERVPLETILRNLIGNAFKHHPNPSTGRVTVTAQLQNGWVEFTVADNGAGIDPSLQQRIFEIFQTLKSRDQSAGSGVGLTLVKKLVESRSGTVGITSADGAGSTFHFTWPTAASLDARDAQQAADAHQTNAGE